MPHKKCSLCVLKNSNPERYEAVVTAHKSGATLRVLERRFGVARANLNRHFNHDKNDENRINIAQIERIDREIVKLHAAENRAKRNRDNGEALKITRELRNWFTLRAKVEAIAGARQGAQQTAEITPGEAITVAKVLIESNLTDADVVAWLHTLMERVPAAPAVEAADVES